MMTNMLTDARVRDAFVAEMRRHAETGQIVQGVSGDPLDAPECFKGGFLECAWNALRVVAFNANRTFTPDIRLFSPDDRAEIAAAMGLPITIAEAAEDVFEGLFPDEAVAFALAMTAATASAAARGADLRGVWPRFALTVLADPERGAVRLARTERTREVLQSVIRLYLLTVGGLELPDNDWLAASAEAEDVYNEGYEKDIPNSEYYLAFAALCAANVPHAENAGWTSSSVTHYIARAHESSAKADYYDTADQREVDVAYAAYMAAPDDESLGAARARYDAAQEALWEEADVLAENAVAEIRRWQRDILLRLMAEA